MNMHYPDDSILAPQKLADLPGHECLTLGGFDRWDFRHRTTGEALAARVHGRFSANSYETLHDVCRGGLGIAYLSHWFAAEDLAQGHLVALRLSDALPEENAIWAVHPTRRLVPAKVRVFTDALQQHFLAQMARHGDPAA